MSYLHIPNPSGNGDQRLGKITHKKANRGAVTADITASGISSYETVTVRADGTIVRNVRHSINSQCGSFQGVNSLRYQDISGQLNDRFHH